MNAQISFLDGTFTLIHVPLSLYSNFLQPILQILLPASRHGGHDQQDGPAAGTDDDQPSFLNISVTPIECSIVCPSSWATHYFEPAVARLPRDAAKQVSMSKDSFSVISVISAGMDAGSRVVDLTSPLALAGVTIFFITTYYADFILVPTRDRQGVVQALLARGFEFSEDEASFVGPGAAVAAAAPHSREAAATQQPPTTPPPSSVAELQTRTFPLFRRRNVVPYVEEGLQLVQCSGRERSGQGLGGGGEYARPSLSRSHTGGGGGGATNASNHNHRSSGEAAPRPSWVDSVDAALYAGLVSALAAQPRFLSVTLTAEDPPSLLLDRSLLGLFGGAVVGDTDGHLAPIFLDLVNLPFEATGIVSGVAGRLVQALADRDSAELSYLSTARAGAVILSAGEAAYALEVLRPLVRKEQ